jgi:DNA-binding transcriptional LysR family regulator
LLIEANVTRAAERVNVGQPAMSASLAKLRRHFKDPLLIRDGRGMTLTPFAASLLEPVNQAVDSMQQVMGHHVAFDPVSLRRTFTVVTSDYVTMVLIKPFLKSIMDVAGGVVLNVVAPGPQMLSWLRRVECDLLIAPREVLPQELAQDIVNYPNRDLLTDRFVLVADQDNTALGDSVSPGELAELPFIDATPHLGPADRNVNALRCICAGNFTSPMHMVAGTPLTTLVQSRLYEALGARFGLRAIPLEEQQSVTEAMYWHPRHTSDPAHMWLRRKLSEVAARL